MDNIFGVNHPKAKKKTTKKGDQSKKSNNKQNVPQKRSNQTQSQVVSSQQPSKKVKQVIESEEDDDFIDTLPDIDPTAYWNPMHEAFRRWISKYGQEVSRVFDPSLDEDTRSKLLDLLPSVANEKYAWAIPDQRAIQILHNYAPIVEIGAGRGYWGYVLRKYTAEYNKSNPDAIITEEDVYSGYDISPTKTAEELANNPPKNKKKTLYPAWCKIKAGDAKMLKQFSPQHTLFLCYPDEFETDDISVAYESLKNFKGDTIITVGETFSQTMGDNPWGKSMSDEFQMHLAASYHKILLVELPSWPGSIDTLSVWKKTQICTIDEDMEFKYIPPKERIPLLAAAPSVRKLLTLAPIDLAGEKKVKGGDNKEKKSE